MIYKDDGRNDDDDDDEDNEEKGGNDEDDDLVVTKSVDDIDSKRNLLSQKNSSWGQDLLIYRFQL